MEIGSSALEVLTLTLILVAGLACWTTIVGRQIADLLPGRIQPIAKYYLAPSFGLALLVIGASLIGRWLNVSQSYISYIAVFGTLLFAALIDSNKHRMICQSIRVTLFSIICGTSILVPLLVFGGYNAQNDAFTYLAHSTWLQEAAFSQNIQSDRIAPLTTQIAMYQQAGYRMGSSFLLALLQSVSNLKWSYSAYPALVVIAVSSTCLAIGFALAPYMRRLNWLASLGLLSIPALTVGGVNFGANFGFLPQTVGIAFGASIVFLSGPTIDWLTTTRKSTYSSILKLGIVISLLLSALILAYSELSPFVILALFAIAAVSIVGKTWRPLALTILFTAAITLAILNLELVRVYSALRLQSGAVVGTPVNWTLLGFITHGIGIHGGPWDVAQWTNPMANWLSYSFGLGLTFVALALIALSVLTLVTSHTRWSLLPSAATLGLMLLAIVWFRYGVSSPFEVGTGQSWSQFKLADWSHPFVSVFILLGIISTLPRDPMKVNSVVSAIVLICGVITSKISIDRVAPVAESYGAQNITQFFLGLRDAVNENCDEQAPVYLALSGPDQKLRQLITLLLFDREVRADWSGDDYTFAFLPVNKRTLNPSNGDCIISRRSSNSEVGKKIGVGAFDVHTLRLEGGGVWINPLQGAYTEESDSSNRWHWVEQKIVLELEPYLIPDSSQETRITFDYQTRGPQRLTLNLTGTNSQTNLPVVLRFGSQGSEIEHFDRVVPMNPSEVRRLEIESNVAPSPLPTPDTRIASWRILNLQVQPFMRTDLK